MPESRKKQFGRVALMKLACEPYIKRAETSHVICLFADVTPFTHLLHLPCLSWSTVFALCELKYQQSTLKLCCPVGSYHPCHHLRLLPLLLVALIVPLLLSCLALLALCLLLMFVLGWTGHPMSKNGGPDWA